MPLDTNAVDRLRRELDACDAVVVGAGAGLSTSAGFIYTGQRFTRYFFDFIDRYGFRDMYTGGFYRFPTEEEHWAYWSRYIYINRYMDAPKPVYETLFSLVRDKDYFVITTNVDHCFQKAGFAKERLFYTQGDYGLFQCSKPCHQKTYDNAESVRAMVVSQGWTVRPDGDLVLDGGAPKMAVDAGLVPHCPVCGRPMRMNLRSDMTFVEDDGWRAASQRYDDFLHAHRKDRTLFLELGVGANTPSIIKYPFLLMANDWPNAFYACVNFGEAYVPRDMTKPSLALNGDIGEVLEQL